jgi:hypothetical protein
MAVLEDLEVAKHGVRETIRQLVVIAYPNCASWPRRIANGGPPFKEYWSPVIRHVWVDVAPMDYHPEESLQLRTIVRTGEYNPSAHGWTLIGYGQDATRHLNASGRGTDDLVVLSSG